MSAKKPIFDTKNVLVTGGAGFIGSHLSAKLLELGADVTVLDDCSAGDPVKVPSEAHFIEGCITDSTTRASVLDEVDVGFQLAAIASVPLCEADPERSDQVNRQSSLVMLHEASCCSVGCYRHLSLRTR